MPRASQARLGLTAEKRAALSERVEDRIGFPQAGAIVQFERRDLAVGIFSEEPKRPGLAILHINENPLIRYIEQIEFVAIDGKIITVDLEHFPFLPRLAGNGLH